MKVRGIRKALGPPVKFIFEIHQKEQQFFVQFPVL